MSSESSARNPLQFSILDIIAMMLRLNVGSVVADTKVAHVDEQTLRLIYTALGNAKNEGEK